MVRRYSDALSVSHEDLVKEGVFDGFVEIDSRLHIDPHLLQSSSIPELRGSYERFHQYFEGVIHLLEASSTPRDRFFREAARKLRFREIPFIALGYSKSGIGGSGIGPILASNLAETASEIISAGIKDPVIFELVGLLEEGIGADRISDMTCDIILHDLLKFSERVAKNLKIKTKEYIYRERRYNIPYDPENRRRFFFLSPRDILRDLPVAHDWEDIDVVCSYNEALRYKVNQIIGNTWKHATRKVNKYKLREILIKYPDVFRDLINQYKSKSPTPYDFEHDPSGELVWYNFAQSFAKKYPLELIAKPFRELDDVIDVAKNICLHFKRLVESNGLWIHLYDDSGKLRRERYAQLLFFGIADAYCEANNIDISREASEGRGSVDFKLSRGYGIRVLVEVKYSRNTNLIKGYKKQLPAYEKAERTEHSIYLVIRTTPSKKIIDNLIKIRDQELLKDHSTPDLIIVEGRKKVSASRL